ncbi:MAG: hypothetical protein J3K34DRAFT_380061, partial [Monoraphidium minutum]
MHAHALRAPAARGFACVGVLCARLGSRFCWKMHPPPRRATPSPARARAPQQRRSAALAARAAARAPPDAAARRRSLCTTKPQPTRCTRHSQPRLSIALQPPGPSPTTSWAPPAAPAARARANTRIARRPPGAPRVLVLASAAARTGAGPCRRRQCYLARPAPAML